MLPGQCYQAVCVCLCVSREIPKNRKAPNVTNLNFEDKLEPNHNFLLYSSERAERLQI